MKIVIEDFANQDPAHFFGSYAYNTAGICCGQTPVYPNIGPVAILGLGVNSGVPSSPIHIPTVRAKEVVAPSDMFAMGDSRSLEVDNYCCFGGLNIRGSGMDITSNT